MQSGAKDANITCQYLGVPRTVSSPATWPKKTPQVIPNWQSTPTAPRCFKGAISVMYIGNKLVASPPERPKNYIRR